jgi:hypothetical protein
MDRAKGQGNEQWTSDISTLVFQCIAPVAPHATMTRNGARARHLCPIFSFVPVSHSLLSDKHEFSNAHLLVILAY